MAAAGGGGGGGGAAFFLQAPSKRTALSATTVATAFQVCCFRLIFFMFMLTFFTFNPPANPKSVSSSDEVRFISNSSSVANYVR
jgi:hypothetical protein